MEPKDETKKFATLKGDLADRIAGRREALVPVRAVRDGVARTIQEFARVP